MAFIFTMFSVLAMKEFALRELARDVTVAAIGRPLLASPMGAGNRAHKTYCRAPQRRDRGPAIADGQSRTGNRVACPTASDRKPTRRLPAMGGDAKFNCNNE
jgi:hypothetical protein